MQISIGNDHRGVMIKAKLQNSKASEDLARWLERKAKMRANAKRGGFL